ncbi:hypothetical protein P12x_002791 [Tundrisphaera lichenicola]|uniref:hypothetical protein n=1 Tax=Tundrisphaera lichenicola TaxID=2029860 RepID=UPI003EB904C7
MKFDLIRKSSQMAARRRAIALGALAALAFPACASDGETVATYPAGSGMTPPPMTAEVGETKTASAPLGYPWANNGPTLPTASSRAGNSVVR